MKPKVNIDVLFQTSAGTGLCRLIILAELIE